MRIVIMADGKGMRWNNYLGIPKHLVMVGEEELIARTVRLLKKVDDSFDIIVTSHDERYEFPGSSRYEPLNNVYEIDRFTEELIVPDMCFLYGDTFYTEKAIKLITKSVAEDILFFGNRKSIVGIKISDSNVFSAHVANVKKLYLQGKIDKCTGWQVYRSFTGQAFTGNIELKKKFLFVDEETRDVNTPSDYEMIEK